MKRIVCAVALIILQAPAPAFAEDTPPETESPSIDTMQKEMKQLDVRRQYERTLFRARHHAEELEDEWKRDQLKHQLQREQLEGRGSDSKTPFVDRRVFFQNILGVSVGSSVGSWSIGLIALGGVGGTSYNAGPISFGTATNDAGISSSSVAFTPSVDVRVGRRITVGGTAVVSFSAQRAPDDQSSRYEGYTLAAAPRVGVLLDLGAAGVLWPQWGVGIMQSRVDPSLAPRQLATTVSTQVEVAWTMPLPSALFAQLVPNIQYAHTFGAGLSSQDGFAGSMRVRLGVAF